MFNDSSWRVLCNHSHRIIFESDIHNFLEEVCEANNMSFSEVVNYLLRYAFENREAWEG